MNELRHFFCRIGDLMAQNTLLMALLGSPRPTTRAIFNTCLGIERPPEINGITLFQSGLTKNASVDFYVGCRQEDRRHDRNPC